MWLLPLWVYAARLAYLLIWIFYDVAMLVAVDKFSITFQLLPSYTAIVLLPAAPFEQYAIAPSAVFDKAFNCATVLGFKLITSWSLSFILCFEFEIENLNQGRYQIKVLDIISVKPIVTVRISL